MSESNWKVEVPTPFTVYLALSPSTTCRQDYFSTRSVRCSLYPVMCLEAPLSINQISLSVGTVPESADMKKNASSFVSSFLWRGSGSTSTMDACCLHFFPVGKSLAMCSYLSHLKHWILELSFLCTWPGDTKVFLSLNALLKLFLFLLLPFLAWEARAWFSLWWESCMPLAISLVSSWVQSAHRWSNWGKSVLPLILWMNGSQCLGRALRVVMTSSLSDMVSPMARSWSLRSSWRGWQWCKLLSSWCVEEDVWEKQH